MAALPGWTSLPTPLVGTAMECLNFTNNQTKTMRVVEKKEAEEHACSPRSNEEESIKERFESLPSVQIPLVRCAEVVITPKPPDSGTPAQTAADGVVAGPSQRRPSTSSVGRSSKDVTPFHSESDASGTSRTRSGRRRLNGDELERNARERSERRRHIRATPAASRGSRTGRTRAEEEEDSGSDSSVMSVESRPSKVTETDRPRGRPPSTGDYVGLAAAKERLVEARRKEFEFEMEQRVFDMGYKTPAPSKASRPMADVEELMREARQLPASDLVAEMIRSTDLIRRVASNSGNLKGTFVRSLRQQSNIIEAYAAELAKRPTTKETQVGEAEEIGILRQRLKEAEERNQRLGADLAALKLQVEELKKSSTIGTVAPREENRRAARRKLDSSPQRDDVKRRQMEEQTSVQSVAVRIDPSEMEMELENIQPKPQPPRKQLEGVKRAVAEKQESASTTKPAVDRAAPAIRAGLESVVEGLVRKVEELAAEIRGRKTSRPAARDVTSKKTETPKTPTASSSSGKKSAGRALHETAATNVAPAQTGETWATVVGRKAKREAKKAGKTSTVAAKDEKATPAKGAPKTVGKGQQEKRKKVKAPRPPRTAAVTLTVAPGAQITYAQAMMRAREATNLEEIGIKEIKIKRAVTGGLILGIPGQEGGKKATELAERLRGAFRDGEVKVARPLKMAEIRLLGLDDSITPEEVASAVSLAGGCEKEDVKVGAVRRAANGLGTAWARCPLTAVRKIEASGRVRVGWSSARVEVLAARPMHCFRCLQRGHTAQQCPSDVDRSGRCYACGGTGHRAAECREKFKCPLCSDMGRPASHRLGATECAPAPKGKKRAVRTPGKTLVTTRGPGAATRRDEEDVHESAGGSNAMEVATNEAQ